MAKLFTIPFAVSGDKTAVPDALQPGGEVSYTEGWTADYQADQDTDPNAKDYDRQKHNQVMNDITSSIGELQSSSNTNKLINPGFNINQRGSASYSAAADTYTLDRWVMFLGGKSTVVGSVSQESFTAGQTDVPRQPENFIRVNITTAASSFINLITQPIENSRTLNGEQVVLEFWHNLTSSKVLNVQVNQGFGTGGAPSAGVDTVLGTITGTGAWKREEFTVALPSISGKTIGTDNNDALALTFQETSAFSTYTFDLSQPYFDKGSVATASFRTRGEELSLSRRFFQIGMVGGSMTGQGGTAIRTGIYNPGVIMRAPPTLTNRLSSSELNGGFPTPTIVTSDGVYGSYFRSSNVGAGYSRGEYIDELDAEIA